MDLKDLNRVNFLDRRLSQLRRQRDQLAARDVINPFDLKLSDSTQAAVRALLIADNDAEQATITKELSSFGITVDAATKPVDKQGCCRDAQNEPADAADIANMIANIFGVPRENVVAL